jgi:hypothetical protein
MKRRNATPHNQYVVFEKEFKLLWPPDEMVMRINECSSSLLDFFSGLRVGRQRSLNGVHGFTPFAKGSV